MMIVEYTKCPKKMHYTFKQLITQMFVFYLQLLFLVIWFALIHFEVKLSYVHVLAADNSNICFPLRIKPMDPNDSSQIKF